VVKLTARSRFRPNAILWNWAAILNRFGNLAAADFQAVAWP
jgi:hypothetical protein